MTETADLVKGARIAQLGKTGLATADAQTASLEENEHPKRASIPLSEKIFGANRNNIFNDYHKRLDEHQQDLSPDQQNLSFTKPRTYRIDNYRFITHPVEANPDGTHTYTIERRDPNSAEATVVEIIRDPETAKRADYPEGMVSEVSFRGYVGKGRKRHWVNVSGKEAKPYAEDFLTSMTPKDHPVEP